MTGVELDPVMITVSPVARPWPVLATTVGLAIVLPVIEPVSSMSLVALWTLTTNVVSATVMSR